MLLNVLLAALVVASGFATPILAQAPPPTQPTSRLLPEDEPAGVPLSLSESLRRALERNLDLVQVRFDPRIGEENVIVQEAGFDPELRAEGAYEESEREPARIFDQAGKRAALTASADFVDRLMFGADYDVGFNTSRETGNVTLFEPYYQSGLNLLFNMPLLRGRGREATTELLVLARGDFAISREELRRQAQLTSESVEAAYWDLVAARRALGVSRQALGRADDLLGLNRKKVEVGTLAPIEITQAEAGVASQEEGVIVAETALENAEDELLRLMATPPEDPLWSARLEPTDEPLYTQATVDLQGAIDEALQGRPEIATARHELQKTELSERVARNALRPGLDLHLRLFPSGNNNEGGTLNDPDGIPGSGDEQLVFNEAGYGTSISEISDFNNYFWDARVNYTQPIGNRAAKANHRIATLNRERSEVSLQSQQQNIRVEVRNAARAVESAGKRVEAARKNVELQRRKLEAEQKKLENGMSTSFEVLTFQTDLADAELSEIRAVIDYRKALAALERAKGTLLEARGLTLAP